MRQKKRERRTWWSSTSATDFNQRSIIKNAFHETRHCWLDKFFFFYFINLFLQTHTSDEWEKGQWGRERREVQQHYRVWCKLLRREWNMKKINFFFFLLHLDGILHTINHSTCKRYNRKNEWRWRHEERKRVGNGCGVIKVYNDSITGVAVKDNNKVLSNS